MPLDATTRSATTVALRGNFLSPRGRMLLNNSFRYLIARGVPGLIQLGSFAVFSRLLSPAEYGRYALAVAVVTMAKVLLFEWIHLGVFRLLPRDGRTAHYFATLLGWYSIVGVACLPVAAFAWLVWPGGANALLVSAGIVFLLALAFHELNLLLAAVDLSPFRYGAQALLKAIAVLGFGTAGAMSGFDGAGLLLGVASGFALPTVLLNFRIWSRVSIRERDPGIARELARYGLPLSVSVALGVLFSNTDRLVLGAMTGVDRVGEYALGCDVAAQTVGMLMMAVNLAAYPLAINRLEREGPDAARQQLAKNGVLLVAVSLPCASALSLTVSDLALMFGSAFRAPSGTVMGWIAFSTAIAGLRAYYFDLAFQLGKKTTLQVIVAAASVIVNVGLNIWLVSRFDLYGAAVGTTAAAAFGLVLSALLGRRILPLPLPWLEWAKCGIAAGMMIAAMSSVGGEPGLVRLLGRLGLGAVVFGVAAWILNVAAIRRAHL